MAHRFKLVQIGTGEQLAFLVPVNLCQQLQSNYPTIDSLIAVPKFIFLCVSHCTQQAMPDNLLPPFLPPPTSLSLPGGRGCGDGGTLSSSSRSLPSSTVPLSPTSVDATQLPAASARMSNKPSTQPPPTPTAPHTPVGLPSKPALPEPSLTAAVRPPAAPPLPPAPSVIASGLHIGGPAPRETVPEPAGQ